MAISCCNHYKFWSLVSNADSCWEIPWLWKIHSYVQVSEVRYIFITNFFSKFYSRSVCLKMLKFFACYIWLILGFLTAFLILFSSEKDFKYFPVPLITMLVWMTGEMDSDILHPKTKNIRLTKNRTEEDTIDVPTSEYIGISHNSEDNLQFEGTYNI